MFFKKSKKQAPSIARYMDKDLDAAAEELNDFFSGKTEERQNEKKETKMSAVSDVVREEQKKIDDLKREINEYESKLTKEEKAERFRELEEEHRKKMQETYGNFTEKYMEKQKEKNQFKKDIREQIKQESEEKKQIQKEKSQREHDEWMNNLIGKPKGKENNRLNENKPKEQETKRGQLTTVQVIVRHCATCQLWGGYRKVDEPLRKHVEFYPNEKGRCYAPNKPSGWQTNSLSTCANWQKWSISK